MTGKRMARVLALGLVLAGAGLPAAADLKVTVEISAEFPNGATDQTKRAVTENAGALGFKSKSWE